MADVVAKVRALAAYITFSHDDTSFIYGILFEHNIDILSESA
jgi:hypothetical protein